MRADVTPDVDQYEDQLLEIARKLPDERVRQLVDFARFLELLTSEEDRDPGSEGTEGDQDVQAREEWDALLARPDAKSLLREMAREARDNYAAGRTTGFTVTDDGRLEPQ